jgi:hypothetical protein
MGDGFAAPSALPDSSAAGAALREWSDAPRLAAEALLWLSWGIGLLATIAPRPLSLTALLGFIFPLIPAVLHFGQWAHRLSSDQLNGPRPSTGIEVGIKMSP